MNGYATYLLQAYLERFARNHGLTASEVRTEIEGLCAEYNAQFAQMSQRLDTLRLQLAQAHRQPNAAPRCPTPAGATCLH